MFSLIYAYTSISNYVLVNSTLVYFGIVQGIRVWQQTVRDVHEGGAAASLGQTRVSLAQPFLAFSLAAARRS